MSDVDSCCSEVHADEVSLSLELSSVLSGKELVPASLFIDISDDSASLLLQKAKLV